MITRINEFYTQISALYGRAFFHDPLYAYIIPDDAVRESLVGWEMGRVARYCLRFGEVYATPGLTGCACWLPPGQTDFTQDRMDQVGMDDAATRLGPEAAARYEIFVAESEHYHHQVAPGPHWYLVVLGVEPAHQGRGLGRALLQPVLARADAGGTRSIWKQQMKVTWVFTPGLALQSKPRRGSLAAGPVCGIWCGNRTFTHPLPNLNPLLGLP
ncbi:MAG: GNAT family N-acetyltransferase [Anaerolineales bacterium]